jgi:hypothetical protein
LATGGHCPRPEKGQGSLAYRAQPLELHRRTREKAMEWLISGPRNRKVEMRANGKRRNPGKFRSSLGRPMWEPGVGGRQPGGTDSPDKGGASRVIGIRGSLQTRGSRHAAVAKVNPWTRQRGPDGFRNREVEIDRGLGGPAARNYGRTWRQTVWEPGAGAEGDRGALFRP